MKSNNTKHTSGTWVVDNSGTYLQIRSNLSDRKHMAHEEVVARIYHTDAARLIAAAPELLEALEWVLGHVKRCTAKDSNTDEYGLGKIKVPYGTGTVVDAKLILDKITDAINKAKGGAE